MNPRPTWLTAVTSSLPLIIAGLNRLVRSLLGWVRLSSVMFVPPHLTLLWSRLCSSPCMMFSIIAALVADVGRFTASSVPRRCSLGWNMLERVNIYILVAIRF